MAGICGITSKENCIDDLFWGSFYLQHRAQNYCGIALCSDGKLEDYTRKGLLRPQFPADKLSSMKGNYGIGSVSSAREPVSELSKSGGMIISFDGNLINHNKLKEDLLRGGATFSGHRNPEEINDSDIISKIISSEISFEKGIERLIESAEGDFAIVALAREGVYGARGWGRKPLILGKKDGTSMIASESNSFINRKVKIERDVAPGEIVLLNNEGIHQVKKFNLNGEKYCTFEWVYTAYPSSKIDGVSVAIARQKIGGFLAEKYPVEADIVSPIPNSGRWHAIGYAAKSEVPYFEVFVRYDYSDRSYTPGEQYLRDLEAQIKLIPIEDMIRGNKIISVDDSIVRGTQTLNQVERLKYFGALAVHARIACPPLMSACRYGKTTKKDDDCIARRMPVEDIRDKLKLDSLEYATVDILEKAIGLPRDKLCLDCWNK